MTEVLSKLFVKDYNNLKDMKVRNRYGNFASLVGIITNFILFAGKFLAGSFFGSVAITADAINNLSDAGSAIISIVSFKLSSIPPDEDHPFGHARIEYIATMIVAILILFLGVEVGKSSFRAILNPVMVEFNMVVVIVLVFSILVKLWLYIFNRNIGEKINSAVLLATATDSLSDTLSTSVVLISALLSSIIGVPLDGYMGGAVAIFILISGINIIKDTMNKLLGDAPSKEMVDEIYNFIVNYGSVLGVHDLVVHSYGPGKYFASVHVEVSSKECIMKSHDMIDNIEREILKEMQIHLVIHLDPVAVGDPKIDMYRLCIETIIKDIDDILSIHDFRVVLGGSHNNLIFDMVVPHRYALSDRELQKIIENKLAVTHPNCYAVITYDSFYTSSNF